MTRKAKPAATTTPKSEATIDVEKEVAQPPVMDKTEEKKHIDPLEGFELLITDGKALKLSPNTKNHVLFQLGKKVEDNKLYLRMSGNEGGGLHSKEWVSIEDIVELLDEQEGKAIKSTILKPVFKGGSANNCGFMAAVLRCKQIDLLAQSENSVFTHRLSDNYQSAKEALLAMAGDGEK